MLTQKSPAKRAAGLIVSGFHGFVTGFPASSVQAYGLDSPIACISLGVLTGQYGVFIRCKAIAKWRG
tara:strand:+ start:10661 stop:10861 length:201 start_codon:yes stop_codon:yes gene_type:complete